MSLYVSDSHVQEEYRKLSAATVPRPRTEAEYNDTHASATLACNRTKNRYTDVLPVEETRIKLETLPDEPGSDYINANHVTDTLNNDETQTYICAQAPLQTTLNDFWRMVWEQNVCMIVVLMKLSENGKVKGHRYWPTRNDRVAQFHDITVSLVKGRHFPHRSEGADNSDQTIVRVFELRREEEKRNIVQLHFKGWPDFGVPEATEPIRNLVHIMHFYRDRAHAAGVTGPVVIHCSAGIGRTGTYLAIVFALNQIKQLKAQTGVLAGAEDFSSGTKSFQSDSPSYSDEEDLNGGSNGVSFALNGQQQGFQSASFVDYENSPRAGSLNLSIRSLNRDSTQVDMDHGSAHVESLADGKHSDRSGPSSMDCEGPTNAALVAHNGSSNGTANSISLAFDGASNHSSSSSSSSEQMKQSASNNGGGANKSGLRSPPPESPFKRARSSSTASADSVVYEYGPIDDSSYEEDAVDESTSSSDDERERNHIKSLQRPGSTIPVDVMNIVLSLRKQRNRGMVQTEDQYKFIYRVVFDEIELQKLRLSDTVIQFMDDAMNDLTEPPLPMSSRSLTNSKRKSQPRSPRSTLNSLGSTVSLSASGLSKLSKESHFSSSFSDDDDDFHSGKNRLKSSGDSTASPPFAVNSPRITTCVAKRNLAMSSATIPPMKASNDNVSLSQSAFTPADRPVFKKHTGSMGAYSHLSPQQPTSISTSAGLTTSKSSSLNRRSSPVGATRQDEEVIPMQE